MAKALVTGGAGFIGSHVTDDIVKLGCLALSAWIKRKNGK